MKDALRACWPYFVTAAVFSAGVNVLYLAPTIYLMQLSDRVIMTGSITTLVYLTALLIVALGVLSALDQIRSILLIRAGNRLDRLLAPGLFRILAESEARTGLRRSGQAIRELDSLRQFLTGVGALAAFDLPWLPIYFAIIFMVHPVLGLTALAGGVISVALAVVNEAVTRRGLTLANRAAVRSYERTDGVLQNSDVVQAMGMLSNITRLWQTDRREILGYQEQASQRGAALLSLSRFFRLLLQSIMMTVGAYLVIEREVTSGGMFAASILLGRALSPLEMIVGNWRSFIQSWQSYQRLEGLFRDAPPAETPMPLPKPLGQIAMERVVYAFPGTDRAVIKGVSFEVEAGECIGIAGPSGAGKSTLARLLIGIVTPNHGTVRLDEADLRQWPRDRLGQFLGYLPQQVNLLAGTVSQNIARFGEADPDLVIEAARLAGVHEMILRLPNGYDTQIGDGGVGLSGGQAQRIGIARAIYGRPPVIVFDEPNANLDGDGEVVLMATLQALKRIRATVFLIAHRPAVMAVTDRILVLRDGMVQMFDKRATVLAQVSGPAPGAVAGPAPQPPGPPPTPGAPPSAGGLRMALGGQSQERT